MSCLQGDFALNNVQDGFLATAFLVGLLIASPIFSELCKHHSAFRLIGYGMGTWTLATFGCGISLGFWSLILCRMFVGVGEASFVALAAPFIDDYAPAAQKASWFATFYLCIPVGFAAGYIYGGLVAAALGWRAAFLIEAAVMVPFVVFCFMSKPLHLTGSREQGPDPAAPKSLKEITAEFASDARKVASHSVWLHMCSAYILYTAVLGVYAFWGPKAGKLMYDMAGESADLVFGGVTVITGVFGSLGGGLLLDKLGSTLANANLICGLSNLVGLVFVLLSFLVARSFAVFIALFAIGELALFMMQAPVGAIGMWSVPAALRPLAISMVTVSIHLLGDVPSPPLVGALQTALEARKPPESANQQWRVSMSIISLLLLFSGLVFLRSSILARQAADYRKPDELAAVSAVAEQQGAKHKGGRGRSGKFHNSSQSGAPDLEHSGNSSASFASGSGRRLSIGASMGVSGVGVSGIGDQMSDKQPLLDPQDPDSGSVSDAAAQ
eukprot:GHRR01018581.1.p1 GENE.GHRR01018581.1~~GHRR01018581.1.p1  ORF type:complete len:498 (+),score=156.86 GHRR01018581.1:326-1819(+)